MVIFADEDRGADYAATLRSVGVSSVASPEDFHDEVVDVAQTEAADAIVFAELAVAVVSRNHLRSA